MMVARLSFLLVLTMYIKQCRSLLPALPNARTIIRQRNTHKSSFPANTRRQGAGSSSLSMALVPLPVDDLEDFLVVGSPSGPQYATYWGRTKVRRFFIFPLEHASVFHNLTKDNLHNNSGSSTIGFWNPALSPF
jgi:hypothetical protein